LISVQLRLQFLSNARRNCVRSQPGQDAESFFGGWARLFGLAGNTVCASKSKQKSRLLMVIFLDHAFSAFHRQFGIPQPFGLDDGQARGYGIQIKSLGILLFCNCLQNATCSW